MSNKKLEFFIGPCVLESEELAMTIAEKLSRDLEEFKDDMVWSFKGSFDKANRTSISSYRGPGLDEGLRILEKVGQEFDLPTLTDFHYPDQAKAVAEVVSVLQVPAFLCRQTDMIEAGALAAKENNARLKVKKGQFLSPEETVHIVEKAKNYLPLERILLTERGSSFGYNNLIVDMASFQIMKGFGVKAIHDATHSVQRPGAAGNQTGGKREQIRVLARAAVAAGADGVFMETHPRPKEAKSDSSTCLPLDEIKSIVSELLKIHSVLT